MDPSEKLQSISVLKKLLDECPGCYAALIATDDGFDLAHQLPNDLDEKKLAAMTSSIMGVSEGLAREIHLGRCNNVIVENELGTIVAQRIDKLRILCAISGKDTHLGMLLTSSRKAITALNEL